MNLVGKAVKHKAWKNGTIINSDETHVVVHFDAIQQDKQFVYPDAFEKFLAFEDEILQDEAIKAIALKKEQKQQEKERHQKELEKKLYEDPIDIIKEKKTGKKKSKKLPPRKNLAFKLNYCDGGAACDSVGYKAACSDETIKYNIFTAKRSWCGFEKCPCRRYIDGKITREELDDFKHNGETCYESRTLTDWVAQAGTDLKGVNSGKARRMPNAQLGSLAVLTTRFPGEAEADRVVVGVFIVDAVSEGDDNNEGTVTTHSKYRVEIRPNEIRKLKFWNYYRNEGNPEALRWGTGLYRFMKDEDALALLEDIAKVKEGTADYGIAVETLNYFKELHNVDSDM